MLLTEQALQSRARRAYELARLRRATGAALPLLLLAAVSAALSARPGLSMAVGAGLVTWGIASLWVGGGIERALVPGLVAGLAPLLLVTCASRVDHVCLGAACRSVCLAASLTGGSAAGLFVGRWAAQKGASLAMAAGAAGSALLTGSLACSCIGLLGLAALGGTFLATAPLAWALSPKRASHREH
jgi:hypothetical protein